MTTLMSQTASLIIQVTRPRYANKYWENVPHVHPTGSIKYQTNQQ